MKTLKFAFVPASLARVHGLDTEIFTVLSPVKAGEKSSLP